MKANLDLSVYYVEPPRGGRQGGERSFIKFYQPSGTISLFVRSWGAGRDTNRSRNYILHLHILHLDLHPTSPSPSLLSPSCHLLIGLLVHHGGYYEDRMRQWGSEGLPNCHVMSLFLLTKYQLLELAIISSELVPAHPSVFTISLMSSLCHLLAWCLVS